MREAARREKQDEDRICRETDATNTMEGLYIKVEENGEVVVDLGADGEMTSIITMGSISKLGLAEGSKVTAIVKATSVIMAVKK